MFFELKWLIYIEKISPFSLFAFDNCQRASRAKTRDWRGDSIIELCIGRKKLECL